MYLKVIFVTLIAAASIGQTSAFAKSCVWKVSAPNGHALYLGGSFHALRPEDHPIPAEFNRAFDASSRLVFEEDPKKGEAAFRALLKAGQYPKGDSLKNHVDPRTYAYLRRFFALLNVPEDKYSSFRPWLIDLILSSPPPEWAKLGVERVLEDRAKKNSKPISGLESPDEHNRVFSGLNDRQGEALLLVLFINAGRENSSGTNMIAAWRRGDEETLERTMRESFRDFPAMASRLLDQRNRNWVPKIEGYLRSNQTYFVVVGAAHLGGPNGLLALLRARGYKLERV